MNKILPLLLLLAKISFAQVNLDSTLIAWYSFTGNAADSSGNHNDGIVHGATLTSGKQNIPNTAYHFNGIDNYINVPNSPTLTPDTNITMCAIVKPYSFYNGPCQGNMILIKGTDHAAGAYELIYGDNPYDNGNCNTYEPQNETFYGEISANNFYPSVMAYPDYIDTGKWYCVAATWNGNDFTMYVDGVPKFTASDNVSLGTNTYPLTIGRMIFYPDTNLFKYWLHADVDDIRIYNRVLSYNEISVYCRLFQANSVSEYAESPFSIFPNPSDGKINITLNKNIVGEIIISNLLGEVIYSEKVNWDEGSTNAIKLNASSGIYFVQLQTKEGISTKKIVAN